MDNLFEVYIVKENGTQKKEISLYLVHNVPGDLLYNNTKSCPCMNMLTGVLDFVLFSSRTIQSSYREDKLNPKLAILFV